MINITDKHNCCGCSACVQACPKQCISFDEDDKGFRYPLANKELCIGCGLCEKVCPCLNQSNPRKPLKVYAAINPNEEIRMKSSSGGIFTMLAEVIIDKGGVVFGARFDENWEVIHDYTETKDGLEAFRGSKYVQSRIGNTFIQARDFLEAGRKVLFSGTSCQIAGLKRFLRKDYDNLLTVEIVCHGVPSPLIWREYVSTIASKDGIKSISLKDKSTGWRGYSISICTHGRIFSEKAGQNKYMLSFLQNLILRPSCFNCPAKAGRSQGDIALADFWGIEKLIPKMDDNRGTSFVCCNTEIGLDYFIRVKGISSPANYDESIPYNPVLTESTKKTENRKTFWDLYSILGIKALDAVKPVQINLLNRIIKRIIKR